MKRLLIFLLLLVLPVSGLAEPVRTAQELFLQDPVPDVPMPCDPQLDPLLSLINKKNPLKWDDVPELTVPDIPNKPGISPQQMAPDAAHAIEKLFEKAAQDGIDLVAVSGYRSYASQKLIYNRKVEERGEASASLSSAPPGKSEHQAGLAMDLSCKAISYHLNQSFGTTDEGKWLYANCADFGFIIRYKTEWTKITGYKGEPWHIRYVGVEHARMITKLNVPFETYLEYLELCYAAMNKDIPQ